MLKLDSARRPMWGRTLRASMPFPTTSESHSPHDTPPGTRACIMLLCGFAPAALAAPRRCGWLRSSQPRCWIGKRAGINTCKAYAHRHVLYTPCAVIACALKVPEGASPVSRLERAPRCEPERSARRNLHCKPAADPQARCRYPVQNASMFRE